MTWHSIEVLADARADEVVGLLAHRRSGWLRPFLLLAVRADSEGAAGEVWFRLGDVAEVGGSGVDHGGRTTGLRWRPDAGPTVFSGFTGRLVVRDVDQHLALRLDGDAHGGADDVNEGVLTRLVELLADAFAEARTGAR